MRLNKISKYLVKVLTAMRENNTFIQEISFNEIKRVMVIDQELICVIKELTKKYGDIEEIRIGYNYIEIHRVNWNRI